MILGVRTVSGFRDFSFGDERLEGDAKGASIFAGEFSQIGNGKPFGIELIEDAQRRGLLETQKDERSGGYLILSFGPNA